MYRRIEREKNNKRNCRKPNIREIEKGNMKAETIIKD